MPTKREGVKGRTATKTKGPSEIAPGIFVGGWKDAAAFEGARICVLDEKPEGMPPAAHMPYYNEATGGADRRKLDELAESIRAAHVKGQPVLIFCGHGIRRSPLGAAWYLHRFEGLSLEGAYDRIQAVRPQIERAQQWARNSAELSGG